MSVILDKYWGEVDRCLDNIENVQSYYAGGTLCIDITPSRGIGLNLDGRGFIFSDSHIKDIHKDTSVILPQNITKKVRNIYLKVKPNNMKYYLEKTKLLVA